MYGVVACVLLLCVECDVFAVCWFVLGCGCCLCAVFVLLFVRCCHCLIWFLVRVCVVCRGCVDVFV